MAPFSTFPFSWGWATLQAIGVICKGRRNSKKCSLKRTRGPCLSRTAVSMLSWTSSLGGALEKMERMQEAAVQSLLPLRMGELQIQQTTMTFNHAQAVEFALGIAIGHGAEMAPVDLALHARGGFEAYDGLRLFGRAAHAVQVIPHNGDPTRKALLLETLAY